MRTDKIDKVIEKFKHQAIELALKEDIGNDCDHTSNACIPKNATNKAVLIIKESGIISGVEIAKQIFQKLDKRSVFEQHIADGTKAKVGETAFTVKCNTRSLLRAERIVLNIMQRMSGIATNTARYVELIKDTNVKVLDTRKTAPCLRYFDKEAVLHGGGHNHRYGLFDMILLKDNHIDYAGGIEAAIKKTQKYLKKNKLDLEIEIEVRTFREISQVLAIGGVNRIMLDNFDIPSTKEAVELINGKYQIESSGGITFETIRDYALCGIDFVSVGALTHNVKGLDMSLKAVKS
ncbi:MAG: carboxylating nicotinate-nucleotide diphosphorylase [Salinivirgaceae bacterium]|jgi:nicotinate-nucleotide pyrophosphorylase (carboxylating)|nr:carboxylating nicotinate-nucleotide diphosphorylase [Bacteroidales bacterium]